MLPWDSFLPDYYFFSLYADEMKTMFLSGIGFKEAYYQQSTY